MTSVVVASRAAGGTDASTMTAHRLRTLTRVWPIAAMLAAPAVLLQFASVRNAIVALAGMMQRGEPEGLAIYVAVYVTAVSVGGPFAIFTGLAGFAFGPARGLAVALPTATLAASSAFLVGRLLGRTRVGATLRANPRYPALALVLDADGLRIATLLRLSPLMPQNVLTYLMALTPLPARHHALATFVGLLPVTVMQVFLGSLVRDAAALVSGGGGRLTEPRNLLPLLGGAAMTALFVTLVVRRGKAALASALAARASAQHAHPEAREHRDQPHQR